MRICVRKWLRNRGKVVQLEEEKEERKYAREREDFSEAESS
jgi:hypothetical protein